MRKPLSLLLVFLVFCSYVGSQSQSAPSAPETRPSPTLDYSAMDVAHLLLILNQDLEDWNNDSMLQEQALKRALELLKQTSQELSNAKTDIGAIRKSLALLETQLKSSQTQETLLRQRNSTLKFVAAASLFAAGASLGYSIGGLPGASIGMASSVVASIGVSLIF